MKQSPVRKLRRDRSRMVQELQLAEGTGDKAGADVLKAKIKALDNEISAIEKARSAEPG